MKKKALLLAMVMVMICSVFGSCADKPQKKTAKKAAVSTEVSSEDSSLPEDVFSELPEGAEGELDYVTKLSASLFPDAKGKKMFGFKGVEDIITSDGTHSCYVFDYYTYKSKVYNKVATLAKDIDTSAVFVCNADAENYISAELPAEEVHWHDKATANILVNGGKITD